MTLWAVPCPEGYGAECALPSWAKGLVAVSGASHLLQSLPIQDADSSLSDQRQQAAICRPGAL